MYRILCYKTIHSQLFCPQLSLESLNLILLILMLKISQYTMILRDISAYCCKNSEKAHTKCKFDLIPTLYKLNLGTVYYNKSNSTGVSLCYTV